MDVLLSVAESKLQEQPLFLRRDGQRMRQDAICDKKTGHLTGSGASHGETSCVCTIRTSKQNVKIFL